MRNLGLRVLLLGDPANLHDPGARIINSNSERLKILLYKYLRIMQFHVVY